MNNIWTDFWEFSLPISELMIQIGVITLLLFIGNTLRRKSTIIRKSLIPTSIIAGIFLLVLRQIPGIKDYINKGFLEAVTYHTLALGCIAIALKSPGLKQAKEKKSVVFKAGLITVNTYVMQGILGGALTLLLAVTIFPDIPKLFVSGLLLPLGFGQGSGQALNFGKIFEGDYGLVGGASFGLTIAAIGFLVACFVGLIHMHILKKQGKLKLVTEDVKFVSNEEVSSPDDVPLTESVDRFTIQIALMAFVYFLTFLFILFIYNLKGEGLLDTIKPLVLGFNFLLGTIFAILLRTTFKGLKKANLMNRNYPNNYLLNRVGGFMFDLMIIAGIGAIDIQILKGLLIPLLLICAVGTVATYFYVKYAVKKTFPKYENEAFISLFGMLTGTNSTGLILLREVDPKFETPAASNLILLSIYAIILGFPLFLLLGFAPKGITQMIISLVVLFVMFLIYNFILFYNIIIKKK